MIRGKRGTLQDVIFLAGAGFFVIFLTFLLAHFTMTQIFSKFLESSVVSGSPTATSVLNSGTSIMNQLDKLAIAAFFAIFLVFIVTSWFTAGHPILIVVYILGGIAAVLISMFTSNLWEDITVGSQLVSSLTYFPFANHVMLHLPIYIAVFFVIGLIIVFAKPNSQGDFGGY